MGITSKLFITSLLVLITGIVVHEYAPQYTVVLMKYTVIREAVSAIYNLKHTYFTQNEDEKPSNSKPTEDKPSKKIRHQEKLFTPDELKAYSGKEGDKGLYLAFMGEVYNVEKGKQFYGPGGGYAFFSGRDGTRAFITGDFTEEGLIDDIAGLTSYDYLGIDEWIRFYKKDYIYVGKLIGRYYDEKGNPTPYNKKAKKWLKEAVLQKEAEKEEKIQFPPCNSEWNPDRGSRVYCTTKSGGIERNWVGVPRKLFSPGGKSERCACVKNFGNSAGNPSHTSNSDRGDLDNPNLKEYPECSPDEDSCNVPNK